jgi:aryl-alcohol dehydrogenase-like predicted oxidoreductase
MRELKGFSEDKNATIAQLALAWLLSKGQNIIPIPGTKKRKYLEQNAAAVSIILNGSEIAAMDRIIAKYPDTGERYGESGMKLVNR